MEKKLQDEMAESNYEVEYYAFMFNYERNIVVASNNLEEMGFPLLRSMTILFDN
jgi:hypothetical protein